MGRGLGRGLGVLQQKQDQMKCNSSISKMIFVVWDLKRLWMKWMIRKRLESDWMDERDREAKAEDHPPCVYLPFLKGTSVDERE